MSQEQKSEVGFPALEKPCEDCERLRFPLYGCRKCHGTGCVPTEFGEAVLGFVHRHLKVKVGDE